MNLEAAQGPKEAQVATVVSEGGKQRRNTVIVADTRKAINTRRSLQQKMQSMVVRKSSRTMFGGLDMEQASGHMILGSKARNLQ